jgi:hypothetical protein
VDEIALKLQINPSEILRLADCMTQQQRFEPSEQFQPTMPQIQDLSGSCISNLYPERTRWGRFHSFPMVDDRALEGSRTTAFRHRKFWLAQTSFRLSRLLLSLAFPLTLRCNKYYRGKSVD